MKYSEMGKSLKEKSRLVAVGAEGGKQGINSNEYWISLGDDESVLKLDNITICNFADILKNIEWYALKVNIICVNYTSIMLFLKK